MICIKGGKKGSIKDNFFADCCFLRSYFPLSTLSFLLRLPLRSIRNKKGCRFYRGYAELHPIKSVRKPHRFLKPMRSNSKKLFILKNRFYTV